MSFTDLTLYIPQLPIAYGVVEAIVAIVALAASATASYANYAQAESAAKTQANQAELNANAQAAAAQAEAERKSQEQAEATRRKAAEQRRFRASQIAEMSGQGIQLTGTPLDIMADTAVQQQQELADMSYMGQFQQNQLDMQRRNAIAAGQNGSALALSQRPNKTATILSGAASAASSAYGAYNSSARTAY